MVTSHCASPCELRHGCVFLDDRCGATGGSGGRENGSEETLKLPPTAFRDTQGLETLTLFIRPRSQLPLLGHDLQPGLGTPANDVNLKIVLDCSDCSSDSRRKPFPPPVLSPQRTGVGRGGGVYESQGRPGPWLQFCLERQDRTRPWPHGAVLKLQARGASPGMRVGQQQHQEAAKGLLWVLGAPRTRASLPGAKVLGSS